MTSPEWSDSPELSDSPEQAGSEEGVSAEHSPLPPAADALSPVLIALIKGVLYREQDARQWQALLEYQARVRDYVSVLGLELMLDEAEGYAWLRTRATAEGEPELPRLVGRRQLSYPVSLLIALLRRKLAEFDASGGDSRLILSRDEIVELMRTFLPPGTTDTRLVDQIDAYINKVVELGFARRLRGQDHMVEVRRILKAFVDAQWLGEFDARLRAYRDQLQAEQRADGPAHEH